MSGLDEVFNPSAAQAREDLDRQKTVGEERPAPADLGDRPQLGRPDENATDPARRYRGKVVIRLPHADPEEPAPPA